MATRPSSTPDIVLNRRSFLRAVIAGAAVSGAAGLLAACGGQAAAPSAAAPSSAASRPAAAPSSAAPSAGSSAVAGSAAASPARSASAAASAAPANLLKVKVGVPGVGISFLPVDLGIAAGIFRDEGLDLEMASMQPPLALAAVGADQLDYVLTVGEGIRAALKGVAPIKLVGGVTNSVDWFLYGSGNVRTMQDLKGKSIGVGAAKGEQELAVRAALSSAGLDVNRDNIGFRTGLQTPDRISQMQQNRLDAAMIAPPAQFKVDDLGFHRLSDIGQLVKLPIVAWATSDKKIKTQPDDVKRVLRATLKSVDYVFTHRDAAVAHIQKQYDLTADQAKASLDQDAVLFSRNGDLPEDGIANWLKVFVDTEEISGPAPAPSSFEDLTLLAQVQKELNIK